MRSRRHRLHPSLLHVQSTKDSTRGEGRGLDSCGGSMSFMSQGSIRDTRHCLQSLAGPFELFTRAPQAGECEDLGNTEWAGQAAFGGRATPVLSCSPPTPCPPPQACPLFWHTCNMLHLHAGKPNMQAQQRQADAEANSRQQAIKLAGCEANRWVGAWRTSCCVMRCQQQGGRHSSQLEGVQLEQGCSASFLPDLECSGCDASSSEQQCS